MSAFAGVLDGQWLWVAIEARPGSIALRERTGTEVGEVGDVVALPSDVPEDQPAYRSARMDLGQLPDPSGTGEATYDVVVVPPGGRGPAAVWTAPFTGPLTGPLTGPPPSADGRTQWSLHRSPEGTLQVIRRRLPATAVLRTLRTSSADITLTIAGPGDTLALLGDDDAVVATYAAAVGPAAGEHTISLTAGPLEGLAPQITRVALGAPGAWLPVRRHHNDLLEPGRGAVLPELHVGDGEQPLARLRWSGRATLQLRVLELDDTDGDTDGDTDTDGEAPA